jgi:carbamoyltransferase
MNIRLNQRLRSHPLVKEMIVHPGCGDAGTAIGAAAYAVREQGIKLEPVTSLALGPSFSSDQCVNACMMHRERPLWELLEDPIAKAAELLANGQLLAWFQGRMEFGPRALGNRSILANPVQTGITDAINQQVKFREHWRPFSPSILDSVAAEMLPPDCQDEHMLFSTPGQPEMAGKVSGNYLSRRNDSGTSGTKGDQSGIPQAADRIPGKDGSWPVNQRNLEPAW